MFLDNVYSSWSIKVLFGWADFKKKHIKESLPLYFHWGKTLTEIYIGRNFD